MPKRRRFRRPVLSRLTWAWLGASAIGAFLVIGFIAAALNPYGAGRIALPISELEYTANARAALSDRWEDEPSPEVRFTPPSLRDPVAGAAHASAGADARDVLIYPAEDDFFEGETPLAPEDFVITIDGERQGAAQVVAAAVAPLDAIAPIPGPDPAMLRATPLGKVPRIAPDGRTAMEYYSRRYHSASADDWNTRPRVAVIVGGLGLNPALTEKAIDELPADISLAFAPYAKDLDFWTEKARKDGHEILIELPMEGYGPNHEALGAAALLSSRSPAENLQRLDWLLSRFGGYFAATNYLGARFSADAEALTPVLEKLREAGVAYIDDTGAAARAARAAGATTAAVDRTIPPASTNEDRAIVRRELAALQNAAKRNGAALAKTYAAPATIEEIARWAASLEAEGFAPAPASSALQAQAATR